MDTNNFCCVGAIKGTPYWKSEKDKQYFFFTLSVRRKREFGADYEIEDLIDCKAIENQVIPIAQYLFEGKQLCISGRLQSRPCFPNGEEKNTIIDVSNIQLLGGGRKKKDR